MAKLFRLLLMLICIDIGFFAMPVIGTELNKIRRRLGLPYKDDFHVTIGRLHPNAKRLGLLTKEINEL